MKTLLYVLTISGLTVGTKLIQIAYDLGLIFLIRRTNLYKISKANITTVFTNKSKNEKKIIPNFLIDKKIVVNDLNILLNGLKLVSDFLEKTILKPNNLNYPISRTQFINSLR